MPIIQWYIDIFTKGKKHAMDAGRSIYEYYAVLIVLYLFPPAFFVYFMWMLVWAPRPHIFVP